MTDFSANIERFTGFADLYDQYRPAPPVILGDLLTRLAGIVRPELVVDLGCGTGISTRYWAPRAIKVIGIDPTPDMRQQAEQHTEAGNVSYRAGFSHQTGLPDHCAQIVTCAQSLHWMDLQGTFEEASRILTPGGVFAAYDYDWPPTTGVWQADAAYEKCAAQIKKIENAQPDLPVLQRSEKSLHLSRIRASGCFRFVKEIVIHHTDSGDAERMLGLMLSQGSVETLLKNGWTEEQLGITTFRDSVYKALGTEKSTWYWSSRVRLGIV